MALNESKGNMYVWVTHTWNTIKGACYHDCSYCYMKKRGKLNPVRFDERELKTDLGQGNTIFVGSSCDMFSEVIPYRWIFDTFCHCKKFDNIYLFQTKDTESMIRTIGSMPPKSKVCTTIETNRSYPGIMRNTPTAEYRAYFMSYIDLPRYVTIEPIMDFDIDEMVSLIKQCKPEQVNIGADSGNNHLPEPSRDKLMDLIIELQKFTVIARKKNLARLLV